MQKNADINIPICERIRQAADDRQMSKTDLHHASKISYRLLHQIWRGEAHPTNKTIWKIAEALKIDPQLLMGNESLQKVVREAPAVAYGEEPLRLAGEWPDEFMKCVRGKKETIEVACNEYRLPFARALEPAVREFEKIKGGSGHEDKDH